MSDMIEKGSTWRHVKSGRAARVLGVYPRAIRYAYLSDGKLTATTYTVVPERFGQLFRLHGVVPAPERKLST